MKKFITHLTDVSPYSPAGHSRTTNFRLLGPGAAGSERFEVILGEIEPGGRADAHAHERIEQAVFVLEGKAVIEIEGESEIAGPKDLMYFPAGVKHSITPLDGRPIRLLIIYAPPLSASRDS